MYWSRHRHSVYCGVLLFSLISCRSSYMSSISWTVPRTVFLCTIIFFWKFFWITFIKLCFSYLIDKNHYPWWSVRSFLLQSFQGLKCWLRATLAGIQPWAGQLAVAVAPLEVERRGLFTKAPKSPGVAIWISKAAQYCIYSDTDKQWFIPYAFMESCVLSVPATAWLVSNLWSWAVIYSRCEVCPVLCRCSY